MKEKPQKIENNRYWNCIIGLVSNKKLPNGADSPMRKAVEKAYKSLTKQDADLVFSGWGMTEKRRRIVELVICLEEDDNRLNKIKRILAPQLVEFEN